MSTKIVPYRFSLNDHSRNAVPTALVRRLLRADLSGVRVDIALRRKVVALRAVLMRAIVWMNNGSVLLGITVDTQVACLSGAAGRSACRAVRTVRTVKVAAPPEHRQCSQEEQQG